MLRFLYQGVTFQEVPDEISMVFYMLGCPRHCEDCHSKHFWDTEVPEDLGKPFTLKNLSETIQEHRIDYDNSSTLLFMGGDWEEEEFLKVIQLFVIAFTYDDQLKLEKKDLAWFVGTDKDDLKKNRISMRCFDVIKYGKYIKELGGLDNPNTNQLYFQKSWNMKNYLFRKGTLE